jgi:hypothetical protein
MPPHDQTAPADSGDAVRLVGGRHRDKLGRVYGSGRRLLGDRQLAAIRQAWAEGASRQAAARAGGVSLALFNERLADQLADLPRRGQGCGKKPRLADPTPDEIALRAAQCRRLWDLERYGLVDPTVAEIEARLGKTASRLT